MCSTVPACGLFVGFEPRPCKVDCGGEGNLTGSSTTGGNGPSTASSSSSSGGDGGSSSTDGSETSTGTGGSTTLASGGDPNSASGVGDVSGSGGTSGTGGASTGGASSAGGASGATASGGSGGEGGTTTTGGTTSVPTVCDEAIDTVDVTEMTGSYPVQLVANAAESWSVSWLTNDGVYFRPFGSDGTGVVSDYHVPGSSGSATLPVMLGTSQKVALAFGDTGELRLHYLTWVDPASASESDSVAIDGAGAPIAGGVASPGGSTFMVAALPSNGSPLLARFASGGFDMMNTDLGIEADSMALSWLGPEYLAVYREGTALRFLTSSSSGSVSVPTTNELSTNLAAEAASSPLRIAAVDASTAVVTWVTEAGVQLRLLDAEGAVSEPLTVEEAGNPLFPNVASDGEWIAVTWIDDDTGTLYFRRVLADFSKLEDSITVATGVASQATGLAFDALSDAGVFGVAYATDRLKLSKISCLTDQ